MLTSGFSRSLSIPLALILSVIFGSSPLIGESEPLICKIQGDSFSSPVVNQYVTVRGIVTILVDDGFFIQKENCDSDSLTSDAVFVLLKDLSGFGAGQEVVVSGIVTEYFGKTAIKSSKEQIEIVLQNAKIPDAVVVNNAPTLNYEAMEGMVVFVERFHALSPTNGEVWGLPFQNKISHVFPLELSLQEKVLVIGNRGWHQIEWVNTGDFIENVYGVLDYESGGFRVQLLGQPEIIAGGEEWTGLPEKYSDVVFSAATFNVQNFFDTFDTPEKSDSVLTTTEYQRKLAKVAMTIEDELRNPDILGLQEVENEDVLQALVNRIRTKNYEFVFVDGPDIRGIDVALLYDAASVKILSYRTLQGCTTLIDGLGPDGNQKPEKPENSITCYVGDLPGNRLFSRPPLVVEIEFCHSGCSKIVKYWVIVVHFKSKADDTGSIQYSLVRRKQQAAYISDVLKNHIGNQLSNNILLLGDFNDYSTSESIRGIEESGMRSLLSRVPDADRYTYIFNGISQDNDNVYYYTGAQADLFLEAVPIHINSDYAVNFQIDPTTAVRSSDHDPIFIGFIYLDKKTFLPLVNH